MPRVYVSLHERGDLGEVNRSGEVHVAAQGVGQAHLVGGAAVGVRRAGLATWMLAHRAREVATFRRLRVYRKSMPRRASAGLEVVIE